jgi:hypothetical protein
MEGGEGEKRRKSREGGKRQEGSEGKRRRNVNGRSRRVEGAVGVGAAAVQCHRRHGFGSLNGKKVSRRIGWAVGRLNGK